MGDSAVQQPEFLKKKDVAKLLQVTERTVEAFAKEGRIPAPIRLGTHPRWRRAELMEFLNSIPASP